MINYYLEISFHMVGTPRTPARADSKKKACIYLQAFLDWFFRLSSIN